MNHHIQTQHYVDFLEDAMSLIGPIRTAPDHRMAVRALLDAGARHEQLQLDGPWHLSPAYNSELTAMVGYTPQGGWHGLAGLLVGCHIFRADKGRGFVPIMTTEELMVLTAQDLQQRMVEALTRYLIPPATTAGLLMLLGIHPSWGLRVVFETQRLTPMATPRPWYEDRQRFPDKPFEVLQRALFMVLSTIFDLLLAVDHDRRYRIERFAHIVLEASALARSLILTECPHCHDLETPLFILQLHHDHPRMLRRALDFVRGDLFEHYLIPAGVVRRFDDQTFCINRDALSPDYKMFGCGTLAQGHGLAKVLTQDANAQVA